MADFEAPAARFLEDYNRRTPIRTIGPTPGHRWCEGPRSVRRAASNGKGRAWFSPRPQQRLNASLSPEAV